MPWAFNLQLFLLELHLDFHYFSYAFSLTTLGSVFLFVLWFFLRGTPKKKKTIKKHSKNSISNKMFFSDLC